MAASFLSVAGSPTGYGPAASAAASIPIFDGNNKSFADFNFKLKAVAFELNLDEILLRPQEWFSGYTALQRRVESARTTRSSSEDPAAVTALAASLNLESSKAKLLARILIGKLQHNVSKRLQEALPEDEHFNPISIYKFLKANYSVSEEAKKAQENPETIVLDLLGKRWSHGGFLAYVKFFEQKLTAVFLSRKFSDDSTQRALVSLVVKHLLDQLLSKQSSVFEPLLQ